jgi:hypothetical protein
MRRDGGRVRVLTQMICADGSRTIGNVMGWVTYGSNEFTMTDLFIAAEILNGKFISYRLVTDRID